MLKGGLGIMFQIRRCFDDSLKSLVDEAERLLTAVWGARARSPLETDDSRSSVFERIPSTNN